MVKEGDKRYQALALGAARVTSLMLYAYTENDTTDHSSLDTVTEQKLL